MGALAARVYDYRLRPPLPDWARSWWASVRANSDAYAEGFRHAAEIGCYMPWVVFDSHVLPYEQGHRDGTEYRLATQPEREIAHA